MPKFRPYTLGFCLRTLFPGCALSNLMLIPKGKQNLNYTVTKCIKPSVCVKFKITTKLTFQKQKKCLPQRK